MKFEASRVVQTVEQLGDARFTGPGGLARAADFIAEGFHGFQWQTDRRELRGSRFGELAFGRTAVIGFATLITIAVFCWLTPGQFTLAHRAGMVLCLTALLWECLRSAHCRYGGWNWPPWERVPLIVARPTMNCSAAVRVVFQVPLGEVLPASLPDPRFMLMIVLYLAVLFLLKAKGLPGWLFLVAAGLGQAAIWFKAIRGFRLFPSNSESSAASSAAERSGPAFLLELARSWPGSRSERLETICVAAGGQRLGHAGAREVLRLLKREWQDKPTLLVIVHGPGIGQEIVIEARRNRPLAATAANDLWIPHRTMTTNPFSALTFLWPFQNSFKDYVALFGVGCLGEKETKLDGGALDRTAQLCTEISLRWARQQRQKPAPPAPEEDRTASRSVQNPG